MAAAGAQNAVDMAMSHEPKIATPLYEMEEKKIMAESTRAASVTGPLPEVNEADLIGEEPTEEELRTLRRVSGKIPWTAYTVAFVELCERFGYYGCSVLCTFLPT